MSWYGFPSGTFHENFSDKSHTANFVHHYGFPLSKVKLIRNKLGLSHILILGSYKWSSHFHHMVKINQTSLYKFDWKNLCSLCFLIAIGKSFFHFRRATKSHPSTSHGNSWTTPSSLLSAGQFRRMWSLSLFLFWHTFPQWSHTTSLTVCVSRKCLWWFHWFM